MLERAIDLATDDLIARLASGDKAARDELRKLVAKEIAPFVLTAPPRHEPLPAYPTLPIMRPMIGDPVPWYGNPIRCDGPTVTYSPHRLATTAQTGLVLSN